MINRSTHGGYAALIAVVMLSFGTLAMSLSTLGAAVWYADSVERREMRMQAGLNAEACLITVELMADRDYFLTGAVVIRELGCTAYVKNDYYGHVVINIVAEIAGVKAYLWDVTHPLSSS